MARADACSSMAFISVRNLVRQVVTLVVKAVYAARVPSVTPAYSEPPTE
jgi:hypothetical protein